MMVSEEMSGRRDQGNPSLALGQYIAHRRTYSEVYTSTTSNPFFLNSDDGSNNNSSSNNSNINSKTLALPPPLGFESRYQLQYSSGHGYGVDGGDGDGYGYGGVSRAAKRAAGVERRSSSWDVSEDPELRRRRRLASYKAYSLQGKVKSTVKQSFRWVKGKYNEIIYGFK